MTVVSIFKCKYCKEWIYFDDKMRSNDGRNYVPIQDNNDRPHTASYCMRLQQQKQQHQINNNNRK
jgi:hypothetical protein